MNRRLLLLVPFLTFATQEMQNQINLGLENLRKSLQTQEKLLEEEIKNNERLKEEAIRLIKSLSGKNFITFKRGKDIYIITFDNKTHNLAVIKEDNPYLEQKLKPIKLEPAKLSPAGGDIKTVARLLGWVIHFVATVIFVGQTFFAFKEKRLFLAFFSFLTSIFLLGLMALELAGL